MERNDFAHLRTFTELIKWKISKGNKVTAQERALSKGSSSRQGASFEWEGFSVMQIKGKEASKGGGGGGRSVTLVMSNDDKGLETDGKGGNAKLCQLAVIHN